LARLSRQTIHRRVGFLLNLTLLQTNSVTPTQRRCIITQTVHHFYSTDKQDGSSRVYRNITRPVAFNAVFTLSKLSFLRAVIRATPCCLTVLPHCLIAVLLIVIVEIITSIVIISGTGKAIDFKFGQYFPWNKSPLNILEKRELGRIQGLPKFLPRDASAERGDATVSRLSVCPPVRPY